MEILTTWYTMNDHASYESFICDVRLYVYAFSIHIKQTNKQTPKFIYLEMLIYV